MSDDIYLHARSPEIHFETKAANREVAEALVCMMHREIAQLHEENALMSEQMNQYEAMADYREQLQNVTSERNRLREENERLRAMQAHLKVAVRLAAAEKENERLRADSVIFKDREHRWVEREFVMEQRLAAAEKVVEAAKEHIQRDPTKPTWHKLDIALAEYDKLKRTTPAMSKKKKKKKKKIEVIRAELSWPDWGRMVSLDDYISSLKLLAVESSRSVEAHRMAMASSQAALDSYQYRINEAIQKAKAEGISTVHKEG